MGEIICLQTKHQIASESKISTPLPPVASDEDGFSHLNMQHIAHFRSSNAQADSINVQPVEILLTAALQLVYDAQILGLVEESTLQKRLVSKELDELSQRIISGLRRIRAIAAN